jgi:hypothetical protein
MRQRTLLDLAAALRDLHRALAERVRRDCEQERHGLLTPAEFLHLLIAEPRLAWIRSLSELMVDLDVFLKTDPSPTEDEAAAVRAEVECMLGAREPAETPAIFAAFAQHYRPYVADDPHVATAHSRVEQVIRGLPDAASVNMAEVLHERHRWAEVRRHRRPGGHPSPPTDP